VNLREKRIIKKINEFQLKQKAIEKKKEGNWSVDADNVRIKEHRELYR
jgi:hypothetical protein